MDKVYIPLDDVYLYVYITTKGTELYTSQDGCYAEYEYKGDVYILQIEDSYITISLKGGE